MVDYGFDVGDVVYHIKDIGNEVGLCIHIDKDYDLGGVTTCVIVWGCSDWADLPDDITSNSDIHWTNKIMKANV